MGKAIGVGLCMIGVLTLLGPWIVAYGREWLAIRAGRDRHVDHRDFDIFEFEWVWMIGRAALWGVGLIAVGVAIFLKH